MTPDKVEEIDIAIANLLFAGLSISQMDKIPKWLLENIEKNKDTFRTTLTQHHQAISTALVEALEGMKEDGETPFGSQELHETEVAYNQALTEAQNIIKSILLESQN